jgi:hypothetical protein
MRRCEGAEKSRAKTATANPLRDDDGDGSAMGGCVLRRQHPA